MSDTLSAVFEQGAREASTAGQPGQRQKMTSLRAKGVIAFVALAFYVLLIVMVTDRERSKLLAMVDDLEQAHHAEEQLGRLNVAMAGTLLAVNQAFAAGEQAVPTLSTAMEIEATLALMEPVAGQHARVLMHSHKLRALVDDFVEEPSRGVLTLARGTLNELFVEIDSLEQATREHKRQLLTRYYEAFDLIRMQGLAMGVVGFIVLGAAMIIFFSRLAWDIRKLESHAKGIVGGVRDNPLPVTRSDELGSLMNAVNQMQFDLRQRERHIERARHEQFHREKMAAVGSLAAQLVHEINNPIAAIIGIATSMSETQRIHACKVQDAKCDPELIVQQAKRISLITRQISQFARPQPMQAELLDLNQLVRNTCNFLGYDHRLRRIELATDLDSNLPAVYGMADQLVQVLMNLVINAADALGQTSSEYGKSIRVATQTLDNGVSVEVIDNGPGMDAETLARAFEEYFTTKSPDRGTGLGLALSRELIRDAGGLMSIESRPGAGTRVRIELPLRASLAQDASGAMDATTKTEGVTK